MIASTVSGTGGPQAHAAERQRRVQHLLEQATYFVIFSVPDPNSLSVGVPLVPSVPQAIYRIDIVEAPRRLQIDVEPPAEHCGFRTRKRISQRQVANQTLTLEVSPNNYQTGPGRTPPPTVLVPFLSQRFWMFNGHFEFLDGRGTAFQAIAGGRFFPASANNLWVGGVADIIEGFGALQGFVGNLVINGLTSPPSSFANAFLFRFVDPTAALRSAPVYPVVPQMPDPDFSDSALIPLLGEPDPDRPPQASIGQDGKVRLRIVERLRIADTDFSVRPDVLAARTVIGAVVGERRSTLVFDPSDPNNTIPAYTVDSVFSFRTPGGLPIGTLEADLVEARAFRSEMPGLDGPYFRLGGFGVYGKGTGQFTGVSGMLSYNGAFNLEPWAWNGLYLLRILDPDGRFQTLRPHSTERSSQQTRSS